MGNSSGSYRSTTVNSVAAFDKLPPSARHALANANFDWAPQPLVTLWRNGRFKTGPELAAFIRRFDEEETVKKARKTWGKDYPGIISGKRKSVR